VLASKKGRNVAVWAVLGVVFPLLSLGIILGLDSKRAAGYRG
jgi:hypothetical protein